MLQGSRLGLSSPSPVPPRLKRLTPWRYADGLGYPGQAVCSGEDTMLLPSRSSRPARGGARMLTKIDALMMRRPNLIEAVFELGLVPAGTPVLGDVSSPEDVAGMTLLGPVPPRFARFAKCVAEPIIRVAEHERSGTELSVQETIETVPRTLLGSRRGPRRPQRARGHHRDPAREPDRVHPHRGTRQARRAGRAARSGRAHQRQTRDRHPAASHRVRGAVRNQRADGAAHQPAVDRAVLGGRADPVSRWRRLLLPGARFAGVGAARWLSTPALVHEGSSRARQRASRRRA